MKKIVTHRNPDLDAIASVWLIKRFLPGWEKAGVCFVPAGKTFNDQPADRDPDILHVDTGSGQLDHHQFASFTSAAELTWQFIFQKRKNTPLSPLDKEALERIVKIITEIDNGRDLAWPETDSDRFEFYLHSLIYGLKRIISDDSQFLQKGLVILDGLLKSFKDKIKAEEKIKEKGIKFTSLWGKAIACQTGNEKVLWEAEVQGFVLVIKYDSEFKNRVKIFARFDSFVNLKSTYQKLKKIDPLADWFLHASEKLLLISSDPQAHGTTLSLTQIINLLKK